MPSHLAARAPRLSPCRITDVGLPGGMNGRQIADAAHVFITGYAENAVVGNGHLDRGMEVITKRFSTTALGNRVRDL